MLNIKTMRKAEQFETVELGTTYNLLKYRVVDGKGIELVKDIQGEVGSQEDEILTKITFVRGDKRVVTQEEFENAVNALNATAPYIGNNQFDIESKTWIRSTMTYAIYLTNETVELHNKRYDEAKNIIIQYLNPIPRVDGILHEQLLGMMIADMEYKNSLVPSKESEEAIKNLKLALFWLEERQREREKRLVAGTYKQ